MKQRMMIPNGTPGLFDALVSAAGDDAERPLAASRHMMDIQQLFRRPPEIPAVFVIRP